MVVGRKSRWKRVHLYNAGNRSQVVEGYVELGVKHLTLYAFSTENWNRPQYEVDMTLLVKALRAELNTFQKIQLS